MFVLLIVIVGVALGSYSAMELYADRALFSLFKSFEIGVHFEVTDQPSTDYDSDVAYLQDAVNREMHRVTVNNTAALRKLFMFKKINLCRLILLWLNMIFLVTLVTSAASMHNVNSYLTKATEFLTALSLAFLLATIKVTIPVINIQNDFVCLVPPKKINDAEFRRIAERYS